MGSSSKRRTTVAKLNRESKLREKRADKRAQRETRKAARKLGTAADPAHELRSDPSEATSGDGDGDGETPGVGEPGSAG